MAREVRAFQVTVPAGTPQNAPQVFNLTMPPRVVRRITWTVPPGPRGNVGFQVGMAGTQLIPYNPGGFVVADGESEDWDLEELPSSGAWQVIAYNLGLYPHTLYFRFLVDLPGSTAQPLLAPIPTEQLSQPADQVPDQALSG